MHSHGAVTTPTHPRDLTTCRCLALYDSSSSPNCITMQIFLRSVLQWCPVQWPSVALHPVSLSQLTALPSQSACCTSTSQASSTQAALGGSSLAASALLQQAQHAALALPCSLLQASLTSRSISTTAAASAPGGDTEKRRKRRSDTKLYSCRNARTRSMFDQIWPTLQLTEEEQKLFSRGSRVFVTDLARSIPLSTKFHVAKGENPNQAVHHLQARPLIYESDLHLDAVGEHPRYLKVRRLRAGNYANKLQSVRKLRLLMGFARRYMLQELYELSRLQPGPDRVWKLICAMEGKLPASVLRMGLAHDALAARIFVNQGMMCVNGIRPLQPNAMFVQPGDVIGPGSWSSDWHKKYMVSQMGTELVQEAEASWGYSKDRRSSTSVVGTRATAAGAVASR